MSKNSEERRVHLNFAGLCKSLVLAVALTQASTVLATTGWGRYSIDVLGDYVVSGELDTIKSVAKSGADGPAWSFYDDETKADFRAFYDSANFLLLCQWPSSDRAPVESDWKSLIPIEGVNVWVVDKRAGVLEGPFDELAINNYVNDNRIDFREWTQSAVVAEKVDRRREIGMMVVMAIAWLLALLFVSPYCWFTWPMLILVLTFIWIGLHMRNSVAKTGRA